MTLPDFVNNVLLTGSRGFLGKNVYTNLKATSNVRVFTLHHDTEGYDFSHIPRDIDTIIHLGGVNRTEFSEEFKTGNVGSTISVLKFAQSLVEKPKFIFSSSIQAVKSTPYGESKREAEELIHDYSRRTGAEICILRLPNVFGKWAKPNYNSVVATFCHALNNDLEVNLFDSDKPLELLYVDYFVVEVILATQNRARGESLSERIVRTTPLEILTILEGYKSCLASGILPDVKNDFEKNLFSTFLSYMNDNQRIKPIPSITDDRGEFSELVKFNHFGQISLLKINKGFSRGNHYHHTKFERFIIIKGIIQVTMRSIPEGIERKFILQANSFWSFDASPGEWHSLSNIGAEDALLLIWANEPHSSVNPDTFQWDWEN
jgi:UDP-2-acetamido-2,6-beta-L-arabino-hexul-4-ose reductase